MAPKKKNTKLMKRSNVKVVLEDLKNNPRCPHGPTILFSCRKRNTVQNYFACAAYRDRKHCNYFLEKDNRGKVSEAKKEAWEQERLRFLGDLDHTRLSLTFSKVKALPKEERLYCHTCSRFYFNETKAEHLDHEVLKNITDYQLTHPSEILKPLEDPKKEAQFLFSKSSVQVLVDILKKLKYRNVICMGTPRIHEYIQSKCKNMNSLLLDIDRRFHNFLDHSQFCWYNSFNHHFFFKEAETVFKNFVLLKSTRETGTVLITDPPFGGRVEPLANTVKYIDHQYKDLNNLKNDLSVFWIFPYFMEPYILESLPYFSMLDYKVEYENHSLFKNRESKRGSPVRIFTNVDPSLIKLPEAGFKFCEECNKWVTSENRHCNLCKSCTTKDGPAYVHCQICRKCVKPTWIHCYDCGRCTPVGHKCELTQFLRECSHCSQKGHKNKNCPKLRQKDTKRKKRFLSCPVASKKAKVETKDKSENRTKDD